MEKVYEIYIRCTPERLWEAITSATERGKFQFGSTITGDWSVGGRVQSTSPGTPEVVLAEGEILEFNPPKRLVQTFHALWSDDVKNEGTSRVTWEISQVEDSCCLVVTHDQLPDGVNNQIYGGWPMMLSGLKTWLETGTVLTTPGSLMYS